MSSKPLSNGEQSLLQKGPKFAVSSSKVPLTEYIAITKRICDELGENTVGKDWTEIYQKTKEVLQHFKEKKGHTHNTTKEELEAIKTLKEDSSHVVLIADKGVALVVMDKSQYTDKCMALLNDTKVYKPCKDTTKKLHRDVQESFKSSTGNMGLQDYMIGANYTTKNCSPQVTHPLHLGFVVYQNYIKLIAPCVP